MWRVSLEVEGVLNSISLSGLSKFICALLDVSTNDILSAVVNGVHDSTSLSGLSKLIYVVSQVSVDGIMLAGVEGASHSGEQKVVFLLFWLIDSELARASRLSWKKNETICQLLVL